MFSAATGVELVSDTRESGTGGRRAQHADTRSQSWFSLSSKTKKNQFKDHIVNTSRSTCLQIRTTAAMATKIYADLTPTGLSYRKSSKAFRTQRMLAP
jgi:hypothetical protein